MTLPSIARNAFLVASLAIGIAMCALPEPASALEEGQPIEVDNACQSAEDAFAIIQAADHQAAFLALVAAGECIQVPKPYPMAELDAKVGQFEEDGVTWEVWTVEVPGSRPFYMIVYPEETKETPTAI